MEEEFARFEGNLGGKDSRQSLEQIFFSLSKRFSLTFAAIKAIYYAHHHEIPSLNIKHHMAQKMTDAHETVHANLIGQE